MWALNLCDSEYVQNESKYFKLMHTISMINLFSAWFFFIFECVSIKSTSAQKFLSANRIYIIVKLSSFAISFQIECYSQHISTCVIMSTKCLVRMNWKIPWKLSEIKLQQQQDIINTTNEKKNRTRKKIISEAIVNSSL